MNSPKTDQKRRRRSRSPREEKEFEEYMLQLDRVTRVVKGGRRMRFRATVIIGNRAGRVGIGLGKGADVQIAARKAAAEAKKNLIEVPIVNDTVPHPVKLKFKAARILILPAAPGTGLIAGSAVRKMLELAGVKNILSKNFGTSNRVVMGQAMLKLLSELKMTEAAKKFVANLKKQKEEEKKKRMAAQKNSGKAGRRPRMKKPMVKDKGKPEEQSGLKKAAEKIQKEKGRLETEMEEKKN
ncbi:30S ribosomal protein S5 [Candidatus Gracilibacteria bacterium]|nr:30S ribosomal protein S5 [Candidatus Gracilibacteria bacterium]